MFIQEKFPYLFVALVGLLTWSLNNIIENTKLSPIIEYQFKTTNNGMSNLKLNNLSSSHKLKGLNFKICTDTIVNPDTFRIYPTAPASQIQRKIDTNGITKNCFSFLIEEIHPDAEFVVKFNNLKSKRNTIELASISGDQAVRIRERDFLTLLVSNQIFLNGIIFFISMILIIIYYRYLVKKQKTNEAIN
ncbi:hypothetical protein [Winogradskyella sp. 3972H.M.0a.05]|uniref:hypothetical protein n=1 Tax=Winogradskyella sp. 3972H.M.0a.05 TaxID=2950277 RepID=UPI003394F798